MGAGFQCRGTASRAHGARACAYAVSAGSSAPHAPPGCLQSAYTDQRPGPRKVHSPSLVCFRPRMGPLKSA